MIVNKISFLKLFSSNLHGHGGEKRAHQLEEIVKSITNFDNIFLEFNPKQIYSRKEKIYAGLLQLKSTQFIKIIKHYSWFFNDAASKLRVKKSVKKVNQFNNIGCVILESVFPIHFDVPNQLDSLGIKKIIACPQNLESLVNQEHVDWGPINKTDRLNLEIEFLKKCTYVFTISEEEQWLLNQFGIKAYYLPYYPEGVLFTELLKTREIREKSTSFNNTYLILGSATNTPTYKGMKQLIEFLNLNKDKVKSQFIIAGFGTEVFKNYNSSQISCLGAIEQAKLIDLMGNIKGIIINQGYSTGALTKIPEFLVAGIPIICDEGSARSFRRYDGVTTYQKLDQLFNILEEHHSNLPSIPLRPVSAYKIFKDCLFNYE